MKDTALYEHLLGIETPWSVSPYQLPQVAFGKRAIHSFLLEGTKEST